MRNGWRLAAVFIGLAAGLFAAVTWFGFRPGQLTVAIWTTRFVAPVVMVTAVGVVIRSALRPDSAPDYLKAIVGRAFECEGLCFSVVPDVEGDVAELHVFWQNRFARRCELTITLQRMALFALSRRSLETLAATIGCEGGAFGVTRIPVGVPTKLQGRKKPFEIAASVRYPEGRGEMLRFRAGQQVSSEGSRAAVGTAATFLGPYGLVLTGLMPRRRMRLRYPKDVRETAPVSAHPRTEIFWAPGDPVIEQHALAGIGHESERVFLSPSLPGRG